MLDAEIKGKIPEIENMEDVLTSTIFGLLKYISEKKVLLEILNQAKTIFAEKFQDCINVDLNNYTTETIFWKNFSKYGEPDLIIKFISLDKSELLLCIEVKYYSSKSSDGEDDQLGRYFEALEKLASGTNAKFLGLIYLTKYPARDEINDTLQYLSPKGFTNVDRRVFQLRWFEITSIVRDFDKTILDNRDITIMNDLLKYLRYKNLVEFTSFTFLKKDFTVEPDRFYLLDNVKRKFNGFYFQNNDFTCQIHDKIIYG